MKIKVNEQSILPNNTLRMNKKILSIVLGVLMSILAYTQTINTFEQKADSIFSEAYNANTPGVVASIIKDGKVLYQKGFGLANLETNTTITPQTKFQIGELSKQFTSLAILILVEQGKITLADDIRKYLQELPEYAHTITIRHLLNHSSGLHDINRINTIINGDANILNQEKAIEMVAAQETLSFVPGSKFSFHEAVTESVLMAEIVARSSRQSFPDFVNANIFKPLGMNNSLIRDDSESMISGVAEPYQKEEGEAYKKNEVSSSVIGAINAYSSAEDLSIWYTNFTNPKGALGQMIQNLDTPVQLTNGKEFDYYWGKMTIGREFSHPERGLPIYWTFGFQGGYGSNIFRFMDENIISFVLGNNNQYNGGLAMDIINPFVKDRYLQPAVVDYNKLKTIKMSTSQLKSFEGDYWFKPAGYASKMFVENDTLHLKWLFGSRSHKLVPISNNTFQFVGTTDEVRKYKFVKEGNSTTLYFKYDESEEDVMKSYVPVTPSAEMLQSYTGTYYNKAYKSLIIFHVEDGLLLASNNGHKNIEYRPVKKDVFSSATIFMPALEFVRNQANEITGIKIDGDGVHPLVFRKIVR